MEWKFWTPRSVCVAFASKGGQFPVQHLSLQRHHRSRSSRQKKYDARDFITCQAVKARYTIVRLGCLLLPRALAQMLEDTEVKPGGCAMRGSCGRKGWLGQQLPCPYDGPPEEVCVAFAFGCLFSNIGFLAR